MGTADFVQRLAERIGSSANVSAAFGDPIENDGVTIVPVAWSASGFGGGTRSEDEQSGGGGGGFVSPLGYVEIREGRTRFRPTWDPHLIVLSVSAAISVVAFTIRAVTRRR
jgi:uncharacterized spore protein YtfJ